MSRPELFLIALQYAGVIFAAILGIFGLLNDYRDTNGELKKKGVLILTIFLLSIFVSLSSVSYTVYLENERALQEEDRQTKLLEEIKRSVTKTKFVGLSFKVVLRPNHSQFESYLNRLASMDGAKSNFSVGLYGEYFPDKVKERLVDFVLKNFNLSVFIKKRSAENKSCTVNDFGGFKKFDSAYQLKIPESYIFIGHESQPDQWFISSQELDINSPPFNNLLFSHFNTGGILSTEDLKGACVVVYLGGNMESAEFSKSIGSSMNVQLLSLYLEDGQKIVGNRWTRYVAKDGSVFFQHILPE